jgi:hypothetical protein
MPRQDNNHRARTFASVPLIHKVHEPNGTGIGPQINRIKRSPAFEKQEVLAVPNLNQSGPLIAEYSPRKIGFLSDIPAQEYPGPL